VTEALTDDADLRAKTLEIRDRLAEVYGRPENRDRDPVEVLVSAILSQNTNDTLRDRAFTKLRDRLPTWEDVRDAPVDEIADAIRVCGLSQQKSARIKGALQRITEEQGEIRLDFLAEMDVAEAKQWLTSIHGVGPKTAAIVLLFGLDLPAFPVDTHVHRVTSRLGLIGPKTSREKAHDVLESLVPEDDYYSFHIDLIRHGREVCVARGPRCEICVLTDLCDYYATTVAPA
jgi:endonuclease-3